MKPQDIYAQIINVIELIDSGDDYLMCTGTTVVELPNIPIGTEVLASFLPTTGICELQQPIPGSTEDGVQHVKTLGTFAMKLTLEPITE